MKKQLHKTKLSTVLFSFLFSLFSLFIQAQDYQYEWAKSGGGGLSGSGTGFNEQQDETVRDVVVDADNNYYFLVNLQGGTVNFSGTTLTHYGENDILILALDCEGNLLWHHTIGGSLEDQAYKLGLDSANGLYLTVNVYNAAYISSLGIEYNFPPVHFSEDDVMPLIISNSSNVPQEGRKRGFLLKFDKGTGELVWRKDLQGLVTLATGVRITTGRIFIDSNDIIHQIVGLSEGTHLDGLVTITQVNPQFFLVKYDTDGNILGTPQELPITSGTGAGFNHDNTLFVYDEQLNRYYLAGQSAFFQPLTYGGVALQETGFYILAFDGDTFEELWRRELLGQSGLYEEIKGIAIDEDSNIYLAGKCFIFIDEPAYFGDYMFPQNIGNYEYGHIAFTMKLNSSGEVQWIRTPDGYTNSTAASGTYYNRGITLNGNEVAVLVNSGAHIWGDFSINRPVSHRADPVILRLDKETGEVIGLHDLVGGSGVENEFRVITTDNDGNYIAGGHFFGALTHPVTGEPMYGMGKTDFFMAKLSAYACGSGGNPCLGVEIDVPTGDNTQGVQLGMTLADLDVDGENLQWYADAELTEPLSENHIIENNTTYYVTQTLGGCTSEALAVTVSTLGVSDFQKIQIKLYPNPTSGLLYIETSQEVQSYEVYNLIGQQLLKGNVNDNINLKDLSKGTYIIRLTTQEGTVITEKVIKE
jgi:hypothetical protein